MEFEVHKYQERPVDVEIEKTVHQIHQIPVEKVINKDVVIERTRERPVEINKEIRVDLITETENVRT